MKWRQAAVGVAALAVAVLATMLVASRRLELTGSNSLVRYATIGVASLAGDSAAGPVTAAELDATEKFSLGDLPRAPAGRGDSSDDASMRKCAKALGVKKVALLFLTTQRLPHERTWHLWLWGAVGWLPRQALPGMQAAACGSDQQAWQRIQTQCRAVLPKLPAPGSPLQQLPPQLLYSVYVHVPPNATGVELSSMFHRRLIPNRVATQWGDVSIVAAERALLAAALKDPLNERFVLLSDSDIPLYDPLSFYQQLMADDKSRVNACPQDGDWKWRRWTERMETPRFQYWHFRKCSQFFGLIRKHAEVVVADKEVFASFAGCKFWDEKYNWWHLCVPDEHYLPSLLAVEGLENETYCDSWGVAHTLWNPAIDPDHPRAFTVLEVGPSLLTSQRVCEEEAVEATVKEAQTLFMEVKRLLAAGMQQQEACQMLAPTAAGNSSRNSSERSSSSSNSTSLDSSSILKHRLSPKCMLTARKYPAITALAVWRLFVASCPHLTPVQVATLVQQQNQHLRQAEQQQQQAGDAAQLAAARSSAIAILRAAATINSAASNTLHLLGGKACLPEVQRVVFHSSPGP